ncbi:MAG: hypothetical protein HC836_40915 [Richelia sp. RM2_1_2]|nr:hypothetical protein [Richelia sp. RM2_1_2]
MSEWYYKVTEDPTNLMPLVECLDYFEKEYQDARKEVEIKGPIERNAAKMPGIVEHRFSQLQELEALLVWSENEVKKVKTAAYKKYLENYPRELSSRDAQIYADAEPSVLQMLELQTQIALMRNKFISIGKGLSCKEFQISNIVRLRQAGLDDAAIDY